MHLRRGKSYKAETEKYKRVVNIKRLVTEKQKLKLGAFHQLSSVPSVKEKKKNIFYYS